MSKSNVAKPKIKISALFKIITADRHLIIYSFILTLFNVASTLVAPLLIGNAINTISLNTTNFSQLYKYAIIIGLIYIIGSFSAYFSSYLNNLLAQRVMKIIRDKLMHKLQRMPLSLIDTTSRGDFLNRFISDTDLIGDGVLQGFTQFINGILTIIGIIIFLVIINFYIAIAVVVLTPISVIVALNISKRINIYFKNKQKNSGLLSGITEEMISQKKMLMGFNYQQTANQRFDEFNEEFTKVSRKSDFYSSLINPTTRFFNYIVYIVAGVLGLFLNLTVGSIGSVLMYSNQYARPFNEITSVFSQLQLAAAAAQRVMEVLQTENETDVDIDNALEKVYGDVEFDSVYFSYTKDRPLIQNFNLNAENGKKIAIVGSTGSGKTTIVNLLMRFYDLDRGNIYIDKTDISTVSRKSVRQNFGMVLQDSWVFNATIKENLAYAKIDATDEEIIDACKQANCHDFIIKMPNGYDTIISESTQLSEGQKQLLCISRVMLKNSPMLILDEATSSIDTRTEKYISEAFDKLTKGKTSFIIAHRLSTIRQADLIIVLDKGSVVEKGNHNELLEQKGIYYNLYNSQFSGKII